MVFGIWQFSFETAIFRFNPAEISADMSP